MAPEPTVTVILTRAEARGLLHFYGLHREPSFVEMGSARQRAAAKLAAALNEESEPENLLPTIGDFDRA